jgi:hypothetical protein
MVLIYSWRELQDALCNISHQLCNLVSPARARGDSDLVKVQIVMANACLLPGIIEAADSCYTGGRCPRPPTQLIVALYHSVGTHAIYDITQPEPTFSLSPWAGSTAVDTF